MPMNKDPQGGGVNADGSKNTTYCSYCYQNGAFVGGEMTVGQFQDFCKQKMMENGSSRFIAWLFTRGMKRLKRWSGK
jgi:hypothetical protein